MVRQATRFGEDPNIVGNGLIVIGIAALIGGRLYHVIDQWSLYKDDLLKIVLPPYSGLGVYGGIVTGTIAFLVLVRYYRINPWTWADIVAPGLFVMQAIGRWGNFFNQELYGPPTSAPWGIAIDCAHRVATYPCDTFPLATTHFEPLFLYESLSGILGAAFLLWLSRRPRPWLRRGDLLLIFFIWYAVVRFFLENLRTGNWRLDGIATAQIFSILFGVGALVILIYRHRTIPSATDSAWPRPAEPVDAPAPAGATAPGSAAAPAGATAPASAEPLGDVPDSPPDTEPLT
jgi:phosphatidylglycerol:prolipoprotein diacylglycerol transferase